MLRCVSAGVLRVRVCVQAPKSPATTTLPPDGVAGPEMPTARSPTSAHAHTTHTHIHTHSTAWLNRMCLMAPVTGNLAWNCWRARVATVTCFVRLQSVPRFLGLPYCPEKVLSLHPTTPCSNHVQSRLRHQAAASPSGVWLCVAWHSAIARSEMASVAVICFRDDVFKLR